MVENLQGRVPPVDSAFTRQAVPNTLFQGSIFIYLQIYGVGSNATAPHVPRRGLLLGLVQFASLQTCTFVHALLVQVLHRCRRARWVSGSKVSEISDMLKRKETRNYAMQPSESRKGLRPEGLLAASRSSEVSVAGSEQ